MWLIPSRKRPGLCGRLIHACVITSMSTPATFIVDDLEDYSDVGLPQGFSLMESKAKGAASAFQYGFEQFPHEPWYGLLSDDFVPRTPFWDTALVAQAGKQRIAVANDLLTFPNRIGLCVIGGDLVRAIGYLFPPSIHHLYGDDVWEYIGHAFNNVTWCHNIIVEHMHWSNGKAPYDETYKRAHLKNVNDADAFLKWLSSAPALIAAAREKLNA